MRTIPSRRILNDARISKEGRTQFHETICRFPDLALHYGLTLCRFRGHPQVSNRDTRKNLQHGASFVGKSPVLWRGKAHNFARWPVSRRDEFPSQERPLQQLAERQSLRRSQAVLSILAARKGNVHELSTRHCVAHVLCNCTGSGSTTQERVYHLHRTNGRI